MHIYDDEDDTTVYIYYLNDKIYAWTTRKNDKINFELQRNIKVFKRKKRILSPVVFHAFMQKYKRYQIIDIPVTSKGENFSIYGTYYEDEKLSEITEKLLSEFEQLEIFFGHLLYFKNIPKKYKNAIEILMNYHNTDTKTKINEFCINSLSIFFNLFKNTF